MSEAYYTIQHEGRDELTISRSRFISHIKPAATEEAAVSFIEDVRKAHWSAAHNVWAYKLLSGSERCSDDGEPRGTAGFPVLEVLRKEGVLDAAVVVTRYLGGVKLGTGGLSRTYAQCAHIALSAGKVIRRRPYLSFTIKTDYPCAVKIQHEFSRRGYLLRDTVYGESVFLKVLVPPDEKEALYSLTAELTSGVGVLTAHPDEYLDFPEE